MNKFNFKLKLNLTGTQIIMIIVLIAVIFSTYLSVATLNMVTKQYNSFMDSTEGKTQENDVTIADEYVIRSTKDISDAYKKGSDSGLDSKEKETLDMASKILNEIIKDGMTNYEKEKAVYDWMTHNLSNDTGLLTVIPTTEADCDNPYGVLKYHNAVCVGYATTFRMFMEMMDIPCMVIHSTDLIHSWNLVQLDGNWYHTDIYSDAQNGNYANFNMPDVQCDQEWDTEFFPEANSMEYNMAYMNAEKCDDIYKIPPMLRDVLDEGNGLLALKFEKNLTETDAQIAMDMVGQIESLLWESIDYSEVTMYYHWVPCDDSYLFVVNVEDYEEDDSLSYDSDVMSKMSDVIDEAFGDV